MTAAHIFYIPVILMVGLLAGYFFGQYAAEQRRKERRKKLARRRAIRDRKDDTTRSQAQAPDTEADPSEQTG